MTPCRSAGGVWLTLDGEPSHFRESETGTPMSAAIIHTAEILRRLVGLPIIITSGRRAQGHNTIVGGVEKSQHSVLLPDGSIIGNALDAMVKSVNYPVMRLAQLAEVAGAVGVGCSIFKSYVHFDMREGKKARWMYTLAGEPTLSWTIPPWDRTL